MTTNTMATCQELTPWHTPALPDTINIFLTRVCNYRCRHCYATFGDIRPGFMAQELAREILVQISQEPLPPGIPTRKVTFVGGEPTLCPDLPEIVKVAKGFGLDTAVITNGTRITPAYLDQFSGALDWMGFSIDSFNERTNQAIGRCRPDGSAIIAEAYLARVGWVKERGIGLKVNTVVNAHNWRENMTPFVLKARPDRWKVLQVTPIAGQNDQHIHEVEITPAQFQQFVERHSVVTRHGITMVPETVDVIRGSYVMISPDGRFFENALGRYAYSQPIMKVGLREAFSQVTFDDGKFHSRGGRYDRFARL